MTNRIYSLLPRVVPTYTEDAKKRILQAASEQFKEKGYFQSTMDDIANRLGISKGAIYRYFDSKESLLATLYASGPENLRLLFENASEDPMVAAREVFNKMATRANANLFVDFLAEGSTNIEFQKTLQESIEKFTSAMKDFFLRKNPKITPKEAERLHDSIVALGLVFNGLECWLAIGVSEAEVRKVWGKTIELLLAPLVKKK